MSDLSKNLLVVMGFLAFIFIGAYLPRKEKAPLNSRCGYKKKITDFLKDESWKKKSLHSRYRAVIDVQARFYNEKILDKAIQECLENFFDNIKKWLSDEDQSNRISLEYKHSFPIGDLILTSKKRIVRGLKTSRVIIYKCPESPLGFYIKTIFPVLMIDESDYETMLNYFMGCYFSMNSYDEELYSNILDFLESENDVSREKFIQELEEIIDSEDFEDARESILKHGMRRMNLKMTEEFVKCIHTILTGKKPTVEIKDLFSIK
jgi:hypothetical protein